MTLWLFRLGKRLMRGIRRCDFHTWADKGNTVLDFRIVFIDARVQKWGNVLSVRPTIEAQVEERQRHVKRDNAKNLPFFPPVVSREKRHGCLSNAHPRTRISHRYLFLAMMSAYKRRTCPLLRACNDFERRKNKFYRVHDGLLS